MVKWICCIGWKVYSNCSFEATFFVLLDLAQMKGLGLSYCLDDQGSHRNHSRPNPNLTASPGAGGDDVSVVDPVDGSVSVVLVPVVLSSVLDAGTEGLDPAVSAVSVPPEVGEHASMARSSLTGRGWSRRSHRSPRL